MVSAELAPFAKVGGLADVAEALSRSLASRGHDVRVVAPLYGSLDREAEKIRPLKKLPPLSLRVGGRMLDVRFHLRGSTGAGVKVYLVECPALYDGRGIYTDASGQGFADSLDRAALHNQAALLLPRLLDWPVDIVHAHDASSCPALVYRNTWYDGRALPGTGATVLTIHNLAHQEVHSADSADLLGLPRSLAAYPGLLEFHGHLNMMKAGILAADRVNTVSPNYARETVEDPTYGCGLELVLGSRGDDYVGILNGGDYQAWDPRRDPHLKRNYGPGKMAGKQACRADLVRELGLAAVPDAPVCGFVSRLVGQKGVDLMLPIMGRLAEDGFCFAILGTGEKGLEDATREVAAHHPDRIAFIDRFDGALAHRIYAGSDLFLMPSAFEPCGLSQMYALRYGTPPVVRRTGGLADTVFDVQQPEGTGFVFAEARPEALLQSLRRAEALFGDAAAWSALQQRGMACEFSWEAAAAGYEDLYDAALASRRS